ncbi:MAG: DCL family protein [Chitinophagales bacterium]
MAKSVTIGNIDFKTKKAANEYFSEILNRNKNLELNGSDFDDVYQLLKNHPRASEKIGVGVSKIKVEPTEYANNVCFHIHRIDGSIENFGIGKCIDGENSFFRQFSIGCRKVVKEDLEKVKKDYFSEHSKEGKVRCQFSYEELSWEETNVDHREPNTFSVIVDRFIEVEKIDLQKIEYNKDQTYGNEIINKDLQQKFKEYHKEKALLRIVSKKRNLSKSYLGRISSNSKDLKIS